MPLDHPGTPGQGQTDGHRVEVLEEKAGEALHGLWCILLDRLTGNCAIATASGRADGQGERNQAYFVNDCHTALWVATDGTVYRRDLTW